ncbi:jg20273 [Pararge aegeria aegeria]|uniref:Jg20273 protein n=1 Tax=Pararge aegeria aegeria TaxID=348720 RepID=A0A8S4R6V0_9NEOP|nr:jg20273 [Pararge aegeria aegeria]
MLQFLGLMIHSGDYYHVVLLYLFIIISTNERPLLDIGCWEFHNTWSWAACLQRLPATRLMSSIHRVGGDLRYVYRCGGGGAIPAPNVHRFSELCALPIATSASRPAELCR